jgi:hypothetical protein
MARGWQFAFAEVIALLHAVRMAALLPGRVLAGRRGGTSTTDLPVADAASSDCPDRKIQHSEQSPTPNA